MLRQPATQRYVQNRVDHLIVDEAQDMNGIQIALLKILAGDRAKVMLVGDEDQAIYDWRGAEPDYLIRGFEQDFPEATRYTLPHTFRFGHMLSIAASQVISCNTNRNPKISISAKGTPRTRIHCLPLALGLADLGEHVAERLTSGVKLQDIAVLVRTYDLSVTLELDLHQRGIPYHVYGRPPLMRIPEISALLGVLQLASGRWKTLDADQLRYVIKSLLYRPTLYLDKAAINRVVEFVVRQPERLVEAIRSTITLQTKDYQANQIRDRADLLEILATATDPQEKVLTVLDRYLLATEFERNIEKQSPPRIRRLPLWRTSRPSGSLPAGMKAASMRFWIASTRSSTHRPWSPHNATRVDQLHSSSERGTVVEGLRTWSREKRLSQGRPKRR